MIRNARINIRVNSDVLALLRAHNINISDVVNTTLENIADTFQIKKIDSAIETDILEAMTYADKNIYHSTDKSMVKYIIESNNSIPFELEKSISIYLKDVLHKDYDISVVKSIMTKLCDKL